VSRTKTALAVAAIFVCAWTVTGSAQYGYPYPYPYPAYGYRIDPGSAVRIEVTPKEAEVYLDGYYAGIVDDFDGVFQRLRVQPGQHEITIYHEGFRTVRQRLYLRRNATFKLKYAMVPLAAGEVAEARPMPPAPPQTPERAGPGYGPGMPGMPGMGPRGRRMPPPDQPPPNQPPPYGAPPAGQSGNATLELRVQPADAEVLIDGQPMRATDGNERTLIDVAEGRHSIQVRKAGFIGFLTDVQVRRGETTPVTVILRPQP